MLSSTAAFALLTLSKCAAGPYYDYESVQLYRMKVEGEASKDMLEVWESPWLRGDEHGLRFGPVEFLRIEDLEPRPETAAWLERDQRRLTYKGCHRQPVHWVAIWPGRFRAEPTGEAMSFSPATLEIDEWRAHATLTLETEGGPVVMHYSIGGTGRAAGCSVTSSDQARLAPLLLVVLVALRRRR
jgi:MYXO-CTERM domain-containing protein